MPPFPGILLIAAAVFLVVAVVVLFLVDRYRSRRLSDGSVTFAGWDEVPEDDLVRRIGTRVEPPKRTTRSRRRRDASGDTQAAAVDTWSEEAPSATQADVERTGTGIRYYPTAGPSRLRLFRDAAAVLLVICLAVLAVVLYLPGSQPSTSPSPSDVAQASVTPRPSKTPKPSGSAQASSFPTAVAVEPPAPDGLIAVASSDGVSLSWNVPIGDGGSLISGYQIYKGTSSGNETLLGTTGLEPTYNDSAISPGATYYYYVRAVNAIGPSVPSTEASGTIPIAAPGSPGFLSASASGTSITLSWSKPSFIGGSAVTGYAVYRGTSSNGEGRITTLGLSTGYLDTGRTPGTTYYYVVRAINGAGAGHSSNEAHATIAATGPGVPTSLSAASSAGSVALSWSAPSFNGGSSVVRYNVLRSTSSGSGYSQIGTVTCSCSAPVHYTDGGVAAGSVYYYVVQTVTAAGTSGTSNQATGLTVPGTPGSFSATSGVSQITLAWSAPSSGGSTISGYIVSRSSSGSSGTFSTLVSPTNPGITDSGLSPGVTWYYVVQAVNGIGTGPAAGPVSTAPATAPGAPTGVSASPGNASATVSWTAPSSAGGSPITGYTVTSSPGGLTCSSASSPCTVTGLTNGLGYTFTVTAANLVGPGSPSSASSSVTPTAPTAPGAPAAGLADNSVPGQITVTWSAPSSNGGSAILGYRVYRSDTGQIGGDLGSSTFSYTDSTTTPTTSYTYTVTAFNSVGEGGPSSPMGAIAQ